MLIEKLRLREWYAATRPRVFTASYVPMGVAGAAALQDGVFQGFPFLLALIGVVCLQTAANFINEYYDYRRGAETLKVAGQGMILKNNLLTPQDIAIASVVTTVIGAAIGVFFLFYSGFDLLWVGLGGVLVAILYTAGPFPLAYNGLGEIAVGIFMGPMIVLGAYYVMARTMPSELIVIALPVGLMVAAILHANNIRDLEADRAVNKRTLAVRFGRQAARVEYLLLVGGAYITLIGVVIVGLVPVTALLALITLPEALRLIQIINREEDPQVLHPAQGRTALLHGQFGLWMVVGWLAWLALDAVVFI
ncbi:MAG: 1,4-dihydroxy-2-naphthoate octaprenyltransferase [Anaerolineae bacterium]|jgi:1,4-dihydroxy-2-naphthoate octaprenyltransferase|nr:1,4-dihydroxy-2-naphthoate octaprenyltransferase [Anaerolineae bacterium]